MTSDWCEETRESYRSLLARYGRRILAFRRSDGSWNTTEVYRSDTESTLENFMTLASVHGLLRDEEYAVALGSPLPFLLEAIEDGDIGPPELSEVFLGLCLAHGHTGNRAFLRALEAIASAVIPGADAPSISEDPVASLYPLTLAFVHLPRGFKGRVRELFKRHQETILQRRPDVRARREAVRLAITLDLMGAILGRKYLRDSAREFVVEVFGRKAEEIWIKEVLVARYLYLGEEPEGEQAERVRRYLKRRILQVIQGEETSGLRAVADIARTRWNDVLSEAESSKLSPRLDSLMRDKILNQVNPDGGWGDDYTYRSTATAGIALYNIFLATGEEDLRDAAFDAGEFLKGNLWDLSDGIFYSMDRISEFLFLLHGDLGDDTLTLLLEHYHDRMTRAIEEIDPHDHERLLWYSAELCILTYYLVRMTGKRRFARPLVEVAGNLTHLLDPTLYEAVYHPWFQATILAQEVLTGDDGSYYGIFKPYLARMSIDRDTTINEEIAYQRFLYTYDLTALPGLVRTARRRASNILRKDIILGVTHLIQLAKTFRLLEANDGRDSEDGTA